eukprot:gnl/TRDRNA2_/TRDRNA2_64751_c0_seq1.p1 gnl/TRDRNA2_/TRDRNA2_64751_c0~~gnl/TRDRNA2_/TRDRNA2_64751_c0_seq1.p1  ORF type:complete len:100 (-),score=0.14 gnl/TRDRNA2_/TRDRNA2_64751_c0_seq1:95-394(-)
MLYCSGMTPCCAPRTVQWNTQLRTGTNSARLPTRMPVLTENCSTKTAIVSRNLYDIQSDAQWLVQTLQRSVMLAKLDVRCTTREVRLGFRKFRHLLNSR